MWFWFYLVHPMTVGVDNVGLSHTGHQLTSSALLILWVVFYFNVVLIKPMSA